MTRNQKSKSNNFGHQQWTRKHPRPSLKKKNVNSFGERTNNEMQVLLLSYLCLFQCCFTKNKLNSSFLYSSFVCFCFCFLFFFLLLTMLLLFPFFWFQTLSENGPKRTRSAASRGSGVHPPSGARRCIAPSKDQHQTKQQATKQPFLTACCFVLLCYVMLCLLLVRVMLCLFC